MAFLIAIEGIDGAGKGTQANLLKVHLQQVGYSTSLMTFPQYSKTKFGMQIGKFLDGQYGSLQEIHPLLFSLLFAGDRFESKQLIEDRISTSDIVIFDRYLASNQAHQGARMHGPQRDEFLTWIQEIEQQVFGLPTADLNILLDIPVEVAQNRIAQKTARDYTVQKADLHEANVAYLCQVRQTYLQLAEHQDAWSIIAYAKDDALLSMQEIHKHIIQVVSSKLTSFKHAGN